MPYQFKVYQPYRYQTYAIQKVNQEKSWEMEKWKNGKKETEINEEKGGKELLVLFVFLLFF